MGVGHERVMRQIKIWSKPITYNCTKLSQRNPLLYILIHANKHLKMYCRREFLSSEIFLCKLPPFLMLHLNFMVSHSLCSVPLSILYFRSSAQRNISNHREPLSKTVEWTGLLYITHSNRHCVGGREKFLPASGCSQVGQTRAPP